MAITVQHHPQNQEFTAAVGAHTGELAYSLPADGLIDFTHTFVEEALRGQGVGEALAREALAYARQHQLRVRTSCTFMQRFVAAHPEYQELLESAAAR